MTSPFLWGAGTSNSGLLVSALTLMSTELNALASGSLIVSSVGGTSGTFNNSNTSQGIIGDVWLEVGSTAFATTVGSTPNVACWFVTTPDGSKFESSTIAPSRPPDFVISTPTAILAASSNWKTPGVCQVVYPPFPFKVILQNNLGVIFPATGCTLVAAIASQIY